MNKAEARQYAYRFIAGCVEEFYNNRPKRPLCYDEPCMEGLEGRRLSDKDKQRVDLAIQAIHDHLDDRGWKVYEDAVKDLRWEKFAPKADGKPGAKWKGWADFREMQCRT